MFCKHCGKEIADDSTFCKYCGQNVTKSIYDETEYKDREWHGFSDEDTFSESHEQSDNNTAGSFFKKLIKISTAIKEMPKGGKIFLIICLLIILSCISSVMRSCSTPKNEDSESMSDVINQPVEVIEPTINPTPTKSPEEIKADYERSKEDLKNSVDELKESIDNSYHQATGTEHKTEYERIREQAISVTWRDVVDDYEENTIAADGKYKDQYLKMSGTVSDIGREILGQPYVTFERDVTHGIRVTFDKSEEDKIAKLSKGSTITIVGRCAGELLTGTVDMNNCYITY